MRHNTFLFALGLVCLILTPFVWAEQADRNKPIEITSDDGCTLDQHNGISTCSGRVVIIQGTLRLYAAQVVATQDKSGRTTFKATGSPVSFRQKLDQKNQWVEGQSNRLDYDSGSSIAILTGEARVKRGEDLVMGNTITYNTQTEIYSVTGSQAAGNTGKGRVTVILQPKTPSE